MRQQAERQLVQGPISRHTFNTKVKETKLNLRKHYFEMAGDISQTCFLLSSLRGKFRTTARK